MEERINGIIAEVPLSSSCSVHDVVVKLLIAIVTEQALWGKQKQDIVFTGVR